MRSLQKSRTPRREQQCPPCQRDRWPPVESSHDHANAQLHAHGARQRRLQRDQTACSESREPASSKRRDYCSPAGGGVDLVAGVAAEFEESEHSDQAEPDCCIHERAELSAPLRRTRGASALSRMGPRALLATSICPVPATILDCAEGESAAAAGQVVSVRKRCDRGRVAPRREHHPAAVPSRGWRRTPMRLWRIEWLSVAALSRSLATIARPRACRSCRSPIGWGAHRRRSRRTSTTRLMLTKDSAGNGWPRQEVARSGVSCPPRHHEEKSFPGGPFFALDWAVQHVR
jgi:hypothetical protein